MAIVIVVKCNTDLLEITLALRPTSSFTGLLNSGQQEGHKNCNDGDNDEQLDQCETGPQRVYARPHVELPLSVTDVERMYLL